MKNREKDVPYCGVRPDVIAKAKPKFNQRNLELHYTWMRERMSIWFKKDVLKLPAPWTDDKVLLNHKFTNVRRELDRQSIYLIKHVCANDAYDLKQKMLLIVMFRMYNLQTFFDFAHDVQPDKNVFNFLSQNHIETIRAKRDEWVEKQTGEVKWFTNAFNTGGSKHTVAFPELESMMSNVDIVYPDGRVSQVRATDARDMWKRGELKYVPKGFEPDMMMRVVRHIKHIIKTCFEKPEDYPFNRVTALSLVPENQMAVIDALIEMKGLSKFLAYQIFVDFTYCPEYPFSENEVTQSGPGCSAGLDMVFEDFDGMTHEEALFWLRDNAHEVYGQFGYEPKELWYGLPMDEQHFNVMSLENCFCETLKYIRCVEALEKGEKPRTRVKYNGSGVVEKSKGKKTSAKRLW